MTSKNLISQLLGNSEPKEEEKITGTQLNSLYNVVSPESQSLINKLITSLTGFGMVHVLKKHRKDPIGWIKDASKDNLLDRNDEMESSILMNSYAKSSESVKRDLNHLTKSIFGLKMSDAMKLKHNMTLECTM